MNDNVATIKPAGKGNVFQRFATSLRVQFSAATILMAIVPLVIVAVVLSIFVSRQVRKAMTQSALDHLTAVRAGKSSEIEAYFAERKHDMVTLAESTHALLDDVIDRITTVREIKQDQVEDYFQTTFGIVRALKDNPTTSRAMGDFAAAFMAEGRRTGGRRWTAAYAEFNPVFQSANADFDFDDILLIAADGDVVYSVSGGEGLGEDVSLGDLKDSGLGRVFSRALAGEQEIVFEDFAPYAPLDDAVVAFIAGPVADITGTVVGVVAIQFPVDRLNVIMQQRTGLPAGGETFLAAQEADGRITFRNDRSTAGGGKFVVGYDLSAIAPQSVRNALRGETGTDIFVGGTGIHSLASYAPLDIGVANVNWVIVSRMSLEDALISQMLDVEQDYFQKYAETRGYDDLLLFTANGQLFYSIAREPDYQTNILTGPYKDSNLATLVTRVLADEPAVEVSDFARYAPSQDAPAAFVAAPVVHEGEVELIVVARLSLVSINVVMQTYAGLGETGEAYLVGPDKMWRSDSRFRDQLGVESTVLNTEIPVRTEAALSALAGGSGTRSIEDYRGQRVLSSWAPLVIDEPDPDHPEGITWAIIAEIDESEALADVATMTTFITTLSLILLGVVGVVAAVVGSWIAGQLVRPITGLTGSAEAVAAGDFDVAIAPSTIRNEVGVLTNAFATMTGRLRDMVGSLRETAEGLAARSSELEASQRVTFAASEHADPDQLLNMVVNLIRDQFHLYHVQAYIVEDASLEGGAETVDGRVAMLRQSTGYAGRQLLQRKHSIPMERTSLVTTAIHSREPVVVDDTHADPHFMPNSLLPDTRSEMVVPLMVGGEAIGVLDIQDREPGRFNPQLVELFRGMTSQIATFFESSELIARTTEQSEAMTAFAAQLRAAAEIAQQTSMNRDPNVLLQQTVELMQQRFNLYHAHIYVLETPDGGDAGGGARLVIRAGSGEVGRVLRKRGHAIPLDREKSLVARAARTREPVLIADTTQEAGFMSNSLLPQTRSELAVPLVVGDAVLGVLDVQDAQVGRFTQTDVDTIGTLAGQVAIALRNAELLIESQQAQVHFQAVADYTYNWETWLGADGEYIYISPASERITGYTPQELMDNPHLFVEMAHPDDRAILESHMHTHSTTVESESIEYRIITKEGQEHWVEHSCQAIYDAEGNWVGRRGSNLEITERKQVEIERERFATLLNTAADIVTRVNTLLDSEQIFDTTIMQLTERFGLYHANVYIPNETSGELQLRAGYGEPGRIMLERGHSIALNSERSLVARAARTYEIVSVHDVTEDAGFLPNPLLPDTRSEVAVPGISGDKLVCVFDIQHDQANYFTQADLDVFSTVTGQLATVFQNAELFNQADRERARTQTYLDVAGSIIVALDVAGNITLINKAGCDVLGYAEAELLGKNWFEVSLPAEAAEMVKGVFTQIIAGDIEQTESYENEILTRSGEMRIVVWHNSLIKDDVGNITGILSAGEDITARKQAEQAIAQSEAQQRAILETTPVGIAITKIPDNTILYINPEFTAILGYTEATVHGHVVPNFYYHEADAWATQELLRAQEGILENHEIYAKNANGDPLWLSLSIRPLQYGGQLASLAAFNDITARKRAEQVIRESEARFRDVALSTSDWVWEVDAQIGYTYASDKVVDLLGYTVEEMLGKTPFDLMVPEEAARIGPLFDELVANKQPIVDLENWNVTKDGRVVCMLTAGVPRLDEAGNFIGYRGVDRDITARKRAEEELLRLRSAVEQTGDGIAIVDLDGNVQYLNPAWAQVHGYTVAEVLGKHLAMFHTEEQIKNEVAPFNAIVMQTGANSGEIGHVRKDGTVFPTLMTTTLLKDEAGTPVGLVGTIRDITERQQAAAALQRERQLFMDGPVVIFRWVNAAGWPVEYASPNVQQFIGHSAEDFTSGTVPYATVVHPDDIARVAEEVQAYSEDDRASFEQEYRMVRADGEIIWIYDFTVIVRNEHGEVTHYDGYILDITTRKQAE